MMLGKHCYWIHWQCRHLRGSGGTHGSRFSFGISQFMEKMHVCLKGVTVVW